MKPTLKHIAISAIALGVASATAVYAGTSPYFRPLTQSAVVAPVNAVPELNSPWVAPAGITQVNLTSLSEVESDIAQSVQRVPGLGRSQSMFDMLAYDPDGENIFIPHETLRGAGVTRYNVASDTATIVMAGDESGNFSAGTDFGAFDPARFTPNGTVIAAEEWSGEGRVVEIMNPYASPVDPTAGGPDVELGTDYVIWDKMPRVSHEGINFSTKWLNRVIYFVDENRSGSIYKQILNEPGNYAAGGPVYALKVNAYQGNPELNYNDPSNLDNRTGPATWIRITDYKGDPAEGITNPFGNDLSSRQGRLSADDVGATPYGRPEDMSLGRTNKGYEVLYVTAASEAAVYSIIN